MGKASKQKQLRKSLLPLVQNKVDGVTINVEGKVPEDFRLANKKYFEQHPLETEYFRSPFPGEFPYLPKKVQVRQIALGTRIRIPID
jgi:hypothetical protein